MLPQMKLLMICLQQAHHIAKLFFFFLAVLECKYFHCRRSLPHAVGLQGTHTIVLVPLLVSTSLAVAIAHKKTTMCYVL